MYNNWVCWYLVRTPKRSNKARYNNKEINYETPINVMFIDSNFCVCK